MRIKTRLKINILLIVVITSITIVFLFRYTTSEREKSSAFEKIVGIEKHLVWFNSSIYEFLLYHEARPLRQSKASLQSVRTIMDKFYLPLPEEAKMIKIIHDELDPLEDIILELSTLPKLVEPHSGQGNLHQDLVKRLTSRILVKTEVMNSAANNLHLLLINKHEKILQRNGKIFLSLLILMILVTTAKSIWIYLNVVPPISRLRQGIKALAAGNLDYRVGSDKTDEFGELSRSFDNMAERLDFLTVSREKLTAEIKDRKQIEIKLQKSERKFKDFMMSADVGCVIFDSELNLITVNDKALEVCPSGFTRENLSGKNILEIAPSLKKTERYQKYVEVKNTGKPLQFDDLAPASIFGDRHLSLKAFQVDKGLGIIFTDITKQLETEKARQKSEKQFSTIFEQSPLGIALIDSFTGQIYEVNERFAEIAGRTREEMSTIDWMSITHPDDVQEDLGNMADLNAGKIAGFTMNKRYLLPDGSYVWIRMTVAPLREPGINHTQHLCMIDDITPQILAEKERKLLENRLQQSQKMEAIGTLAGGIAHDFNNILGVIIGYTELAKDDSAKESLVACDLDKVLEASGRAVGLVKQILAFSRQGDGEQVLLSPAEIVKKTITLLRPTLPATIEITQDINLRTGIILADPTQMHQILMNLCTNAFHAMEETGGKLDISLEQVDLCKEDLSQEPHTEAGTFIKLSVCDSGPGIPQEVRDKIFDPYYTTKEIGKGTGLGLSIVHGIVKSYGGFLTLYSQPGEGTVFHVFLPVIDQEVLPDREAIQQIPIGVEKILFIDDEEILADMGKDILERLGYQVMVRKSSLEALETFRNQPDQFDLVITDQTMPGMTGADLARRMLQIRPDIPIILCTGYSSIITEEQTKLIGIKEFVLKPVTKKNIAKLIRKVLDGNQK